MVLGPGSLYTSLLPNLLVPGIVAALEKENVAFDIGAYRDAPPGLRIWCGATVEASDVAALMPWIEWAFETLVSELAEKAA